MNIVMSISSWYDERWINTFYDVTLEEESLIYEIKRYDVMFIKGIGELQVDSISMAGLYVTIYTTYMGGYANGEDRFAEAPWA